MNDLLIIPRVRLWSSFRTLATTPPSEPEESKMREPLPFLEFEVVVAIRDEAEGGLFLASSFTAFTAGLVKLSQSSFVKSIVRHRKAFSQVWPFPEAKEEKEIVRLFYSLNPA